MYVSIKIQPSERCYEAAFVFRRTAWLCEWNSPVAVLAFRLAQVGRGVLIGQRASRLMTQAREAIDSTHAGKSDSSHLTATKPIPPPIRLCQS